MSTNNKKIIRYLKKIHVFNLNNMTVREKHKFFRIVEIGQISARDLSKTAPEPAAYQVTKSKREDAKGGNGRSVRC